jgi:hypothetical protein
MEKVLERLAERYDGNELYIDLAQNYKKYIEEAMIKDIIE